MDWKIELYTTKNNKTPVKEFLLSLPLKLRAKANKEIKLLEEHGTYLREPHVSPVKGNKYKGIYKLRVKVGSDIARIFYFSVYGNKFILLNGLLKKTNNIPNRILDISLKYKNDYERRLLNENK